MRGKNFLKFTIVNVLVNNLIGRLALSRCGPTAALNAYVYLTVLCVLRKLVYFSSCLHQRHSVKKKELYYLNLKHRILISALCISEPSWLCKLSVTLTLGNSCTPV